MKFDQVFILAVAVVSMTANVAFADGSSPHATARPILPGGIHPSPSPTPTSGHVDPVSCAILGGAVTRGLCDVQRECWRVRCNWEEINRDADCNQYCNQLKNHNGGVFDSCYKCLESSHDKDVLCNIQTNVRWGQCIRE